MSECSCGKEFCEAWNEIEIQKLPKASIIDVRDRLGNLRELVDVCGWALLHPDCMKQEKLQKNVAHVLYFFVQEQLQTADEELKQI